MKPTIRRQQLRIAIYFWFVFFTLPAFGQDLETKVEQSAFKSDLSTISATLDTFYQTPTQERLDLLVGLLEKHEQEISPRSKIGALSAVAIGRACQTFNLKVSSESPVLKFAREIAFEDIDQDLNRMFGVAPNSDIRQVNFWLYSFTGSGDLKYIDELIAIAGNYNSDEFKTDEASTIAMSADSLMLRLTKGHPKVLKHLQESVGLDQWQPKKPILKRYIAYATTGADMGEAFDRDTPEGTLRLFFYGMMSQNENLLAATSDPISLEDMKLLTDSQGVPPNIDFKKLAEKSPIKRLKAGDVWRVGTTELKVSPEEDSDRAMIAYLGPAMGPPFRVYKIGGIWQVQTNSIITVRKTAKKLMERRNGK